MTKEFNEKMDALRAVAAKAEQDYQTLVAARKAEIEAATREIHDRYREQANALSNAAGVAERAVTEALSAGATHEWEGRKVTRMERKANSPWSRRSAEMVAIFGVVEVCREGTEFPANLSRFRTPKIGNEFVRLLKADGTPGKMVTNLNAGWKLADEVAK